MKEYLDKIFKDKNGNVVLGQRPNCQIIVAFVAYFLHRFISSDINAVFYIIFILFFAWWAILELTSGVNYFRKTLGFFSIVLITFLIFSSF